MKYYGATLPAPTDVTKLLSRGLSLFPDKTALVTEDGSWSWAELETMSNAYAAGLLGLGLKPGDRVASYLPNSTKLFIHYLGAIKAGLVAVPLNYRYTHFEIDHALEVSGAKGIVYDRNRSEIIGATQLVSGLPVKIIADPGTCPGDDDVAPLLKAAPVAFPERDLDAPIFMFFTSGSTGAAKGVTHTARTLNWVISSVAKGYAISPADRFMSGSSCSHIGGFMTTLATWVEGAMALSPRVGKPLVQLEMMRKWRPTMVVMLPAALFELERTAQATAEDFASLRFVGSGGDKVPEQLEREFTALTGLPIHEVYGMTEIGLSHVNPSSGLATSGSIGRVSCGYVCEVRNEEGEPVPQGEEGKLWVKFPGTTTGYWNRPEATAEVYDEDGWFDTGDIVRADEEGFFYFCGRKKQIIIHDGSNIFPQEVEEALLKHPAVSSAGVIGIHDTVHGENVRAYICFKPGEERPSTLDLIAFAFDRVGYKAPEEVVVLDDMPINPTGKVDRVSLKKLAASTQGSAG